MCKIRFRTLRMINASMTHRPARCSHSQLSAIKFTATAIATFRGFVYQLKKQKGKKKHRWKSLISTLSTEGKLASSSSNLIESRKNVVGKLNFRQSRDSNVGKTDSESNYTLLAERRVKTPISPEFVFQTHGTPKNATKFHVFAEQN